MVVTGAKALEVWARRVTQGYPDVKICNMTSSWKDGLAFCAILHKFRPDLLDFSSLKADDVERNCELVFEIAEKELDIPALLDAKDMASCKKPDRLSILTYLAEFYHKFKDDDENKNKEDAASISSTRTSTVSSKDSPNPFLSSRLSTDSSKSPTPSSSSSDSQSNSSSQVPIKSESSTEVLSNSISHLNEDLSSNSDSSTKEQSENDIIKETDVLDASNSNDNLVSALDFSCESIVNEEKGAIVAATDTDENENCNSSENNLDSLDVDGNTDSELNSGLIAYACLIQTDAETEHGGRISTELTRKDSGDSGVSVTSPAANGQTPPLSPDIVVNTSQSSSSITAYTPLHINTSVFPLLTPINDPPTSDLTQEDGSDLQTVSVMEDSTEISDQVTVTVNAEVKVDKRFVSNIEINSPQDVAASNKVSNLDSLLKSAVNKKKEVIEINNNPEFQSLPSNINTVLSTNSSSTSSVIKINTSSPITTRINKFEILSPVRSDLVSPGSSGSSPSHRQLSPRNAWVMRSMCQDAVNNDVASSKKVAKDENTNIAKITLDTSKRWKNNIVNSDKVVTSASLNKSMTCSSTPAFKNIRDRFQRLSLS